ncbi:MAG TPA: hypothetical protein HA232_04030 [Methanocellales archaeon]|nr:hypothetical protein [Methanocellales archaeon]
MFVDKLFDPENEKWKDTLAHFITLALDERKNIPLFEYHFEIKPSDLGQSEEKRLASFHEKCESCLKAILPPGTTLTLKRWTRWHDQSDFFHGRYILTNKGGIRIDWGLDSGKVGEKTDIALLDDDLCQELLRSFKNEDKNYQLIDMITLEGKKTNS